MIIPYRVDVPSERHPYANWAIIALTALAFLALLHWTEPMVQAFVLTGWSPVRLLGYLFLHVGWMHLIGNLVFLWVFGNAVCAKAGNLRYPFCYLGLGMVAAGVHLLCDGQAAVGASGAINGIIGMFLVWYPLNDVSCFAWFFRPFTFSVSSYWMILLWLAFDIFGACTGEGETAYWAHLGGFGGGFGLAFLMAKCGWVRMERHEKSLLQIWGVGARTPSDRIRESQRVRPGPSPTLPPVRPVSGASDTIRIRCDCGKTLRTPASAVGKRVRCPGCSKIIQVSGPTPAT